MSLLRRIVCLTMMVVGMGAAVPVRAQNQLPSVVQLPTFEFFTFSGSVLVPDSGAGFLGGNKTSAMGSTHRGWNRSFGAVQGNSQATVHAHIIDLSEMDKQLLGGTPAEFLRRSRQAQASQQRAADPDEEGKSLVRYARQLHQQGDKTGSFDTYRMAISVLRSGRLRELAKDEFRRVFGSAADQSLRMASLSR